ncbi:MAG: hypothetical protein HQK84_00940 [Nitrospinae bacterium]|nr:hypothetical protein [Nitrospinota bacterium]
MSFVLNDDVMKEAKKLVEIEGFKSMNAFVEISIKEKVEELMKQRVKSALKEASQDPLFLADLKEVQNDFQFSDDEI